MTTDFRLEISDIDTGVDLTAQPSDEGIQITLEDDNAAITIELDLQHAYLLANTIQQAAGSSSLPRTAAAYYPDLIQE